MDHTKENEKLIAFWNSVFEMSEEQIAEEQNEPEDWHELAPSAKLFQAAASLGTKKKVLDLGCGSAWASVIAAKSGCPDVTAADPAEEAVKAAGFYAELYGTGTQIHACHMTEDWLASVPDCTYDGLICSNVLDVVPPQTAQHLITEAARVTADEADVIIGLNYHLEPGQIPNRSEVTEGSVYINGILRLESRTDEEW